MADLVIDTSALLAVLLNEATRPALIRVTQGHGLVGAPSLPWEVGNALVAGVRRRRLPDEAAPRAWLSYLSVPVRFAEIDAGQALKLAVHLGLHAYDAYVLEAARTERLPLLTLDAALARAAQRVDLRLVEF